MINVLLTQLSKLFRELLNYPRTVLVLILAVSVTAGYFTRDFTFDASPDTLVVQGDPNLATYLEMQDLFGGDDFLVFAYSPTEVDMFDRKSLATLAALQSEVADIAGVEKVSSILDAPLVASPPVSLEKMSSEFRTLRDESVDLALARTELTQSPLFRNYLISEDGEASVIKIDLERDERLSSLRGRRDRLRSAQAADPVELDEVESAYKDARRDYVESRQELIDEVRKIRSKYLNGAEIYISGVPMIAADMVEFVKSDLVVFGSLVMVLIVLLLIFFFRRFRWVVLPLLISGVSILITTGILAFAGKPVTVVSSNFIALLAIICISFSIHLIVRYRELLTDDPQINHRDLVINTMESKFAPCLYTGLTTMLAFGAMLASRIVPVEDFGWMMCLGIVISFFVTYTLFPAALLVLGKGVPSSTLGNRIELTRLLSRLCVHHSKKVLAVSLLIVLIAAGGLTRVSFDNRFVDYFAEETDIYAGMVYIDQHLGGTLPFDIYLDLGEYEGYEGDEADPFAAPTEETWPERYWFTRDRIETVAAVHEKLVAHAETGKVLSISTLERLARQFNDGEPLSNLEMAYALGQLPAGVREQLVEPYAKPKAGYANINARIKESGPRFSRTELIEDIRNYATGDLGLEADRVIVTGMMVLFDDMLKQLADSQRQTLLYVVLATFVMFALLLRSPLLALLALIPNVIAAATVIAVMGYANIPLDMMTITIAAICIGIGVDDAIHYSHRFKAECRDDKTVAQAVEAAHRTIGRAMYFTSTIIIGGFSILTFSNFLPTVYFGSLTALAMLLALLANLTLLPSLLIRFYRKP